ncbi:unnamed protein product [Moneuplotes crassus]|uniref:Uncharacterized protein n=1 Tax=Euplotes crassus TaxID=5936 RepID=A0AAD1U267_EUPCR|nr:unnamed protein product [Moneuplotes crassus]
MKQTNSLIEENKFMVAKKMVRPQNKTLVEPVTMKNCQENISISQKLRDLELKPGMTNLDSGFAAQQFSRKMRTITNIAKNKTCARNFVNQDLFEVIGEESLKSNINKIKVSRRRKSICRSKEVRTRSIVKKRRTKMATKASRNTCSTRHKTMTKASVLDLTILKADISYLEEGRLQLREIPSPSYEPKCGRHILHHPKEEEANFGFPDTQEVQRPSMPEVIEYSLDEACNRSPKVSTPSFQKR